MASSMFFRPVVERSNVVAVPGGSGEESEGARRYVVVEMADLSTVKGSIAWEDLREGHRMVEVKTTNSLLRLVLALRQ